MGLKGAKVATATATTTTIRTNGRPEIHLLDWLDTNWLKVSVAAPEVPGALIRGPSATICVLLTPRAFAGNRHSLQSSDHLNRTEINRPVSPRNRCSISLRDAAERLIGWILDALARNQISAVRVRIPRRNLTSRLDCRWLTCAPDRSMKGGKNRRSVVDAAICSVAASERVAAILPADWLLMCGKQMQSLA